MAAGRDIILEGPPGTSKSTLLRAITAEWGIPLVFVEGNADLTPAKLIGHHNPARVLREDYSADNFVDGPLLEAMRAGGFLYIEEFNRAPEDTLNTLLTAMAERAGVGAAGRHGDRRADLPGDRLDEPVRQRRHHPAVHLGARPAVPPGDQLPGRRGRTRHRRAAGPAARPSPPGLYERLVADAVAVTRATREHPDIRQGSSVRGAIDLTLIAGQLLDLAARDEGYRQPTPSGATTRWWWRCPAGSSWTRRWRLTPEAVLRQIWEDQFILAPAAAAPG